MKIFDSNQNILANHKFFHWFYYSKKKHYYFNFGTGLFIWLFLAFALPFGISNNNLSNYLSLLLILLSFGLVWPVISYLTDGVVKYIFLIKVQNKYQVDFKIFILKIFLLVHIIFVIRNILSNWTSFDWFEYIELWSASVLLISMIYIPFSLYAKSKYYHKMMGQTNNNSEDLFEFIGDGKNTLKMNLNHIIYFKSDDNYVDIIAVDQSNNSKTTVFRATLKSIENQLKTQSQFIRIHRSYLVNLRFLSHSNKTNSLKVKNGESELELPVSKKYQNELLAVVK